MADYIGITEAQSNPFAPLTSELVKQLRDNPIATIKSAPGAPRPNTFDGYFAQGGSNLLSGLLPGDLVLPAAAFTGGFSDTTTSSGPVSAGVVTVTNRATGTLRFRATQQAGCTIKLFKNGVEVASFTHTSLSGVPATQNVDVSVFSGDEMEWTLESNASGDHSITNLSIRADNTVQRYGIIAKSSEVE